MQHGAGQKCRETLASDKSLSQASKWCALEHRLGEDRNDQRVGVLPDGAPKTGREGGGQW